MPDPAFELQTKILRGMRQAMKAEPDDAPLYVAPGSDEDLDYYVLTAAGEAEVREGELDVRFGAGT